MQFLTSRFQSFLELIYFNMTHRKSILYHLNILDSEREESDEVISDD